MEMCLLQCDKSLSTEMCLTKQLTLTWYGVISLKLWF